MSVLAETISANLNNDELSLLAAILTQLADTLATIATERELCGDKKA